MATRVETKKPRILVTDDSRVVRKAACSTLSSDYDVLEASSGSEALTLLQEDESIQAMFLDLWMRGIDGFEVLSRVRQSDQTRIQDLPVIIITGDVEDAAIRERALSSGASDFVGKPFSASQLRKSLEPLLNASTTPLEATAEIHAVPPTSQTSRIEQLRHGGDALFKRCLESRQPLSVLKLRIERAGALYHKTGEDFARQALRDIGKKITHETRRKDMLVRLTVSDFVVVMPSTSALEAGEVSKRILRAVRHHMIEHEGSRFHLSMSGGITTPPLTPQLDFESILDTSAERLERAISEGGSQNISSDVKPHGLRREDHVSLDEAIEVLKKGETASVQSNIKGLLRKAFPLLVFVNARLKLNIDDALKKIHEAIQSG